MNCSSCGANLPPEAAACPVCGTPTPYNVRGPGSSGPYDPTAISSGYGTPPPSTGYGAPTYGAPPSTYHHRKFTRHRLSGAVELG